MLRGFLVDFVFDMRKLKAKKYSMNMESWEKLV